MTHRVQLIRRYKVEAFVKIVERVGITRSRFITHRAYIHLAVSSLRAVTYVLKGPTAPRDRNGDTWISTALIFGASANEEIPEASSPRLCKLFEGLIKCRAPVNAQLVRPPNRLCRRDVKEAKWTVQFLI